MRKVAVDVINFVNNNDKKVQFLQRPLQCTSFNDSRNNCDIDNDNARNVKTLFTKESRLFFAHTLTSSDAFQRWYSSVLVTVWRR